MSNALQYSNMQVVWVTVAGHVLNPFKLERPRLEEDQAALVENDFYPTLQLHTKNYLYLNSDRKRQSFENFCFYLFSIFFYIINKMNLSPILSGPTILGKKSWYFIKILNKSWGQNAIFCELFNDLKPFVLRGLSRRKWHKTFLA